MAGRFNLKLRAHFFNKIDPQHHFPAPNNNVATGVTTDIDRRG